MKPIASNFFCGHEKKLVSCTQQKIQTNFNNKKYEQTIRKSLSAEQCHVYFTDNWDNSKCGNNNNNNNNKHLPK